VNIQPATNGVHDPDNFAIILPSHGLPPDKVFSSKITYQWITVTHLISASTPFSSFVVPDPGHGGLHENANNHLLQKDIHFT